MHEADHINLEKDQQLSEKSEEIKPQLLNQKTVAAIRSNLFCNFKAINEAIEMSLEAAKLNFEKEWKSFLGENWLKLSLIILIFCLIAMSLNLLHQNNSLKTEISGLNSLIKASNEAAVDETYIRKTLTNFFQPKIEKFEMSDDMKEDAIEVSKLALFTYTNDK